MVIFPPRLPLSYSMTSAQVNLVSSLSHPEERALLMGMEWVWLQPVSKRKRRACSTHTVSVFLCYGKENCVSVSVCESRCWTRAVVADSVFQGKREGGGGGEEEKEESSFPFFSFCWRKCHHASVCLATGTKSSHPPTHQHTHTCQGGKEAAKKERREVARKETKGGGRRRPSGPRRSHSHSLTGKIRELPRWRSVARSRSWSFSEGLTFLLPAAQIHCNILK